MVKNLGANLFFAVLTSCTWSKSSISQKPVLDVNGVKMTAQQFSQELAYRLKDHDALSAKDPKLVSVTKSKIAEDFIVQTLAEGWAKENGLVLKAEDLEARVKEIQKNYPDDLSFQQALAEEGISFKQWRDRLQSSLLQQQVMRKLGEGLQAPSDAELQAFYNENKAQFSEREKAQVRQILVETESDAKIIEDELKKGRHMTDLAKKYSISPEGPQGGNVGWIEKGLSDVFEPAFHMKVGRRSPIVKSAFGYHIFELVARKPSKVRAFTEAKGDVRRILMEKSEQSLYLAWLEQQTRKARVYRDQTFIDALKIETNAK
jgi:parvulin-like peptidyl-prolyl isomerase